MARKKRLGGMEKIGKIVGGNNYLTLNVFL